MAVVNRYTDRDIPRLTGGDLIDISRTRDGFEKIAYYDGGELGVQVAGHAEFVGVRIVHPEFFDVFGTRAVAGRTFAADDAERAAVVGVGFARRHFGSAAAALDAARLRREPPVSHRRRHARSDAISRERPKSGSRARWSRRIAIAPATTIAR